MSDFEAARRIAYQQITRRYNLVMAYASNQSDPNWQQHIHNVATEAARTADSIAPQPTAATEYRLDYAAALTPMQAAQLHEMIMAFVGGNGGGGYYPEAAEESEADNG